MKWGLVSCLRRRAERICKRPEDLAKEIETLEKVFKRNGFPERGLKRRLRGRVRNRNVGEVKNQDKKTVWIPYIPGVSDRIGRVVRRLGMEIRFLRSRSLKDILSKAKLDEVGELEAGGVIYRQECGGCEKVYIGETGRKALERKKEHEKDTKSMVMRSAISEHCHTMNHKPNFGSFKVIGKEKFWKRRKIKESFHILTNDTFNRDDGIKIDKRWRKFLRSTT